MDNYLDKNRLLNYFLVMANAEANQLISQASFISAMHLKDGLARLQFQNEIKKFIDNQVYTIRNSKSENECQECVQNLKIEQDYLSIQDRMLRSGEAVVHASVELVKGYQNELGYIINGIGVVTGAFQVVTGVGIFVASFVTGNVVGAGAGLFLVMHGANSVEESVYSLIGQKKHTGLVKEGYIASAEFLGFDATTGREAYTAMDVGLSAYGLLKFTVKPDAWRLFRNIPSDYARHFNNISKASLALKIVSNGPKLKLMYDIHSGRNENN
ncbi:uncharacterized protein DUF4225 [Pantoea ananatis]|uniref:DUF4225 domain-containing protein n=1 Tax=Pantoea ananas TaxID=553 RepID=UPI000DC5F905|nr:DUF4225 domain-containing protein [Pantoea ananatis]RAR74677.1 uncharacterized protein DUF4225 [Pantoea ananatis]